MPGTNHLICRIRQKKDSVHPVMSTNISTGRPKSGPSTAQGPHEWLHVCFRPSYPLPIAGCRHVCLSGMACSSQPPVPHPAVLASDAYLNKTKIRHICTPATAHTFFSRERRLHKGLRPNTHQSCNCPPNSCRRPRTSSSQRPLPVGSTWGNGQEVGQSLQHGQRPSEVPSRLWDTVSPGLLKEGL